MLEAVDKLKIVEFSNNPKQKILNGLGNEKSEEFCEFCEFWEDGLQGETEYGGFPVTDGEDRVTEEYAKQVMKETIEETFECLNHRDVSWIGHKGETLYVTGGMSWGDSPTDSLNTFTKFHLLPRKILKAGGIKI